jgi:hypothetical protein
MAMIRDANDRLIPVKIGDSVCFKSDVEQYGTVIKISGNNLQLRNAGGFQGDYIGGDTETWQEASRCWVE